MLIYLLQGTTLKRPEFDRMIQDIRASKINTVITVTLTAWKKLCGSTGNYIERKYFLFLILRYIYITDDFDTTRPEELIYLLPA